MLSECSSRLNQMPSKPADPRCPYLLQYKIFEDRLKKQSGNIRPHSQAFPKKKKSKISPLREDYLGIVKAFLEKNENI